MTALETSSRTIHACLTTAKAIALFHSSAAQAAVVQLSAVTGGTLVSAGAFSVLHETDTVDSPIAS